MKITKELAELAVEILTRAELDDDSEQGIITVDPNLLFQFYMTVNLLKKQPKELVD